MRTGKKNEDLRDHFIDYVEGKGLRCTYSRLQFFEEVSGIKEHFDADSLYEILKKKGSRIARDTIYRNLPLLLESGVLQKSAGNGHRDFYEVASKGHHDHMVCVQCGKIIEFQCPPIEKLQEEMAKKFNFKLIFHDHRLFGHCRDCQ